MPSYKSGEGTTDDGQGMKEIEHVESSDSICR